MSTATADKTAFVPVEFWNDLIPGEKVLIENAKDPAAQKFAYFVGGCYVAQTTEIAAAIEKAAPHAKRADLPTMIYCDSCGWGTRNLETFQRHRNKHP